MTTITIRTAALCAAMLAMAAGATTAYGQSATTAPTQLAADATASLAATVPVAPIAAVPVPPAAQPADATKLAKAEAPAPATQPVTPMPLFSEDFSFADSAWSLVDAHIGDGMMTHTPKPEHWSNAFYYGALFKDADVRVKARIMDSSDRTSTASSLAFWHADGKNFYVLTFWHDSGFIRVTRYQDGNTIAVVEKTIENYHLSADGWAELRVVTKGNIATVYVDGVEEGKFKGQAPAQGWKIGMFASAPKTGTATVAFRDLRVF